MLQSLGVLLSNTKSYKLCTPAGCVDVCTLAAGSTAKACIVDVHVLCPKPHGGLLQGMAHWHRPNRLNILAPCQQHFVLVYACRCRALQIINETLPALQQLKQQGLVRFIGITGLPFKSLTYVLDRVPPGEYFAAGSDGIQHCSANWHPCDEQLALHPTLQPMIAADTPASFTACSGQVPGEQPQRTNITGQQESTRVHTDRAHYLVDGVLQALWM